MHDPKKLDVPLRHHRRTMGILRAGGYTNGPMRTGSFDVIQKLVKLRMSFYSIPVYNSLAFCCKSQLSGVTLVQLEEGATKKHGLLTIF